MKDLRDYRKSYEQSELIEKHLPANPLDLFSQWFKETECAAAPGDEVNAMTIATNGLDGFPKSRIVLLKMLDADGFIFFTNYHSEKGRAIAKSPQVCLSFFWPWTERQVIIKGMAEKVSKDLSDEYFASRPIDSQLGAAVSKQSSVISSRSILEDQLVYLQKQYAQGPIPRPVHWGGYIVKPMSIEFWQGRPSRLHDRICYQLNGTVWTWQRLSP